MDLHFDHLLTGDSWQKDVTLTIVDGLVAAIVPGATATAERHRIGLPGLPNLHSHAFQRGMSGLAEINGHARDTFWTWREVMYRFALTMTPDDLEAVAAQLYVEMLEAGFTRVGEFHYLHHDLDGQPFANRAEMAERIAAAAAATGLNLTLLPVYYRQGGFGGRPAQPGQRRFLTGPDGFADLVTASRGAIAGQPGANLGIAPHSLRAVAPDDLAAILPLADGGPVHMHAAEQVKEVEDCLAWSGARPVEWLLDHTPADARWCLIHATHTTDNERAAMAARGIVAGLCPITEANLGDGVFGLPFFVERGGMLGIGTDSNVSIDAADELRQLEYAQRLFTRTRNVLSRPGGSTGSFLFEAALAGGQRALGQGSGGIAIGAPADIVSLDAAAPAVAGHTVDTLLDAWIFGRQHLVDCVWTRGTKRVQGGRHVDRGPIAARYARSLHRLQA